MRALPSLSLVALLGAGCGGVDETKAHGGGAVSVGRENGMTFADEASLPACDSSREGFLVYVTGTKSFRSCASGAWSTIDVKGDKGDVGAPGAAGASSFARGLELYKLYRRSIVRLTLTCNGLVTGAPAECGSQATGVFLGTGFVCAADVVCTNAHVVACNASCYSNFVSLKVEALEAGVDSLNPDGTLAPPVATLTAMSSFRYSSDPNREVDLAKFTVAALADDLAPIPLAAKPSTETVTPLQEMLSLSFPLGFQDLYVDMGYVNTPLLGDCANTVKYGCPSNVYDFSTTNDTDHGSSGSPLIDLTSGVAVGVTTAGTEGENANFTWAVDAFRYGLIP